MTTMFQPEKVVAATALWRPECVPQIVEYVRDETYFADAKLGRIFAEAVRFHDAGVAPSDVLLAAGYQGDDVGKTLVSLLDFAASPWAIVDYAKQVALDSARREVNAAVTGLTKRLRSETDPDERSRILAALQAVQEVDVESDRRGVGDVLRDVVMRAHAGLQRTRRYPTGLLHLDKQLEGGFVGEYVVIGARPSAGKSSLLRKIAMTIAKQVDEPHVVFVSLEDSRETLLTRELVTQSRFTMADLTNGIDGEDVERLLQVSAQIDERAPNLRIIDRSPMTIEEIASVARRLHRARPISCLLIDYLQRIDRSEKKATEYEALTHCSLAIADLRKELGCSIIVAAQLNRGADDRERPTYSDLKGTGQIEQDADAILLLHRPNPERVGVVVDKRRNGPKGYVMLGWSPSTTSFYDCEQPAAQPKQEPTTKRGRGRGPGDEHE